MRVILVPLSWVYGLAMSVRNALFDLGLIRVRSVGVPVISVGNMTAGGTGKTPLVEFLVGHLLSEGIRVAVVSRGYGRKSRGAIVVSDGKGRLVTADEGGDEAVQVAQKYPSVPVVVAEKRVAGARAAVRDLGAQAIILDDAFQHRYLRRDLDIVVLDARVDLGRELLLPAGLRREPLRGLRRAGIVALSKLGENQREVPWFDGLRRGAATVMYRVQPGGLRRGKDGGELSAAEVASTPVVAVSGIADNGRFVDDLRAIGAQVRSALGFADHHRYSRADVDRIVETVRESDAEAIATTEKDLARLQQGPGKRLLEQVNVLVLPVSVRWVAGEDVLRTAVMRVCRKTESV